MNEGAGEGPADPALTRSWHPGMPPLEQSYPFATRAPSHFSPPCPVSQNTHLLQALSWQGVGWHLISSFATSCWLLARCLPLSEVFTLSKRWQLVYWVWGSGGISDSDFEWWGGGEGGHLFVGSTQMTPGSNWRHSWRGPAQGQTACLLSLASHNNPGYLLPPFTMRMMWSVFGQKIMHSRCFLLGR